MILVYFSEFLSRALQQQGKYPTVQCAQNWSFWAYKWVLGVTGVILVLLGPVGAYWVNFCGPERIWYCTVPVCRFSHGTWNIEFLENLWKSCHRNWPSRPLHTPVGPKWPQWTLVHIPRPKISDFGRTVPVWYFPCCCKASCSTYPQNKPEFINSLVVTIATAVVVLDHRITP